MTEYVYPRVEYINDPHRTYGGIPYNYPVQSTSGMELRDYFAGQALVATLIAMSNGRHSVRPGKGPVETAAIDSYEMADAMIEQRKATK